MGERTDSDEVDIFVGGIEPDPDSLVETSRFIAAFKQRPDYQAKVEEAKKILADLGIDPLPMECRMRDPCWIIGTGASWI